MPWKFDNTRKTNNNARFRSEGFPSGQRGQTVNLLAYAFEGSNPSPSTTRFAGKQGSRILDTKYWNEAGVAQW